MSKWLLVIPITLFIIVGVFGIFVLVNSGDITHVWNMSNGSVYIFEDGELQSRLDYADGTVIFPEPFTRYIFASDREGKNIFFEGFGFELNPSCRDFVSGYRCDINIINS